MVVMTEGSKDDAAGKRCGIDIGDEPYELGDAGEKCIIGGFSERLEEQYVGSEAEDDILGVGETSDYDYMW